LFQISKENWSAKNAKNAKISFMVFRVFGVFRGPFGFRSAEARFAAKAAPADPSGRKTRRHGSGRNGNIPLIA
jgi:hypothetical protein